MGRRLVSVLPALLLAGCVCLEVEKVTQKSNPDGVRFALPKPILAFTPKGDGTAELSVEYLPDADNTFAMQSVAVLASDTLDVTVKGGLLEQVSWDANSAAVAEQAIATAASLGKAAADAKAAEAGAAAKAQAEEQAAIRELQEELGAAQATVAALEAAGIGGVELARAKAAVAALEARLEARAPANAPGSNQAWGPVFYEIQDNGTSVELVALPWPFPDAPTQAAFATTKVPKGDRASHLEPSGTVSADRPRSGATRSFVLRADGPLAGARATAIRRLEPLPIEELPNPEGIVDVSWTAKEVTVSLPNGTPAGLYELQLEAALPDQTFLQHSIRFRAR